MEQQIIKLKSLNPYQRYVTGLGIGLGNSDGRAPGNGELFSGQSHLVALPPFNKMYGGGQGRTNIDPEYGLRL